MLSGSFKSFWTGVESMAFPSRSFAGDDEAWAIKVEGKTQDCTCAYMCRCAGIHACIHMFFGVDSNMSCGDLQLLLFDW